MKTLDKLRLYKYVVYGASQQERDAVVIEQQSKKEAIAEFKRYHPELVAAGVVCRRYNEADRVSDKMNDELQ